MYLDIMLFMIICISLFEKICLDFLKVNIFKVNFG